MNIMLADLQAPGLDLREMPEVEPSAARGFARMVQQNLDGLPTDGRQVIDFTRLYSPDGLTDQDSVALDSDTGMRAWEEFLAQARIQVTTETDAVAVRPIEVAAGLPAAAEGNAVTSSSASIAFALTGEELPAGGNILPPAPQAPPVSALAAIDSTGHAPLREGSESALPANPVVATTAVDARRGAAIPAAELQRMQPPGPDLGPATGHGRSRVETAGIIDTRRVGTAAEANEEGMLPVVAGHTASRDTRASEAARHAIATGTGPGGHGEGPPLAQPRAPGDAAAMPVLTPWSSQAIRDSGAVTLPAAGPQGVARARDPSTIMAAAPADSHGKGGTRHDARDLPRAVAGTPDLIAATSAPEALPPRNLDAGMQAAAGPAQQPAVSGWGVAGINGLASTQPATVASPLPPHLETLSLARGNDASEWSQGLGDRVSWMVNHKQNSATIRLDPPMLGKLDVQIRMADDGTTITIQTQHLQTRDLVEASSARLRDFLQDSGFQNVNVDVSHRQDQQRSSASTLPDGDTESTDDAAGRTPDSESSPGIAAASNSINLVDTFV